MAAIKKLDG